MEWKQIETKWAEMARRICADARSGKNIDCAGSDLLAGKSETSKKVVAKQIAVVSTEIDKQRVTVSTR